MLGIDEAGRGPWAGPVVAAAVWINAGGLGSLPEGLNDSKKLSPLRRQVLFEALLALPEGVFRYGVGVRGAALIDAHGILPETFGAMDEAVRVLLLGGVSGGGLSLEGGVSVLVDGHLRPPLPSLREQGKFEIMPIIRGDSRSLSIACASIIAKEHRDGMMKVLAEEYGGYGWDSNMGYGTLAHREGLSKRGPTQHHRLSYKPVAVFAEQFGYTR